MKLIELLVQKLGGWPIDKKHHAFIAQDNDGDLWAFPSAPSMNSGRGDWEVNSGDGCYLFNLEVADDNKEAVITRKQYEAALVASKTEWDGEGLPPVGCECEGKQLAQLNWNKLKVVAIENGHVFGFWNDNVSTGLDSRLWEFRPIRSEVDKKKEAAAKGLIEYLDKETDIDNVFSIKDVIGFYDAIAAGKIPHIRID